MLKSLHLKNFTVFPDAEFTFGKDLNVIVGENAPANRRSSRRPTPPSP